MKPATYVVKADSTHPQPVIPSSPPFPPVPRPSAADKEAVDTLFRLKQGAFS